MTPRNQCLFLIVVLVFSMTGKPALALGMNPGVSIVPVKDPQGADEILQAKIEAQLRLDPRLNWELLHVNVDQGHVTLFGEVASAEEKGWAETVASTVPGVKALTNNVIIEQALAPDHKLRTDIWNALKTVHALERNKTLNVSVHNGEAILTGAVQGEAARTAAEKAAESVPGVKKVVNQLNIVRDMPSPRLGETRNPILDGERQVVP